MSVGPSVRGLGARRVALVVTGGTIGSVMQGDMPVLAVDALAAARRLAQEAVRGLAVEILLQSPYLLHSEELRPYRWVELSSSIRSLAGTADGVVVLHGTDTAAYTAAALTYLLLDVDVPVVVTGASAPQGEPGSDAGVNLRGAIAAAAAGLPAACYLAFADDAGEVVVHLGTRVRKVAAAPVRFAGVERRPVAVVRDGQVFEEDPPQTSSWRGAGFRNALDDRVQVIGCHPGQRIVGMADWAVKNGMKALLLRLYAGRTAPTGDGLFSAEKAICQANEAGVVVAALAREPATGGIGAYPSTAALIRAGAVFLDPLGAEAAVPKLMWALSQRDRAADVRDLLRTSIRGDLDV